MTTTDLEQLFGNLEITPSENPLPAQIRPTRSSVPNPFGPALQASLEHSTPYEIYVPADAVSRAVSLLNNAARQATPPVGVRVVVNCKRDDTGRIIKDDNGKVQYLAETKGENKGKVLVRFQANAERKKVGERPFSIVNDPDSKGNKMLKRRSDGAILARGTHDQMKEELARVKAQK